MRVLMVTNIYPTEKHPARGSFIKAQIDSLIREGVSVDVVYINNIDTRFAFVRKTLEIFKRSFQPYDLIHAHYGTSGVAARFQWRLPVVVSYLGSDLLGNPDGRGGKTLYSRFVSFIGRVLSLLVDAIIVKTREMRALIPRRSRVYVIPNGVDFDRFRPEPQEAARKRIGYDPRRKMILFPSNATWERKGFPLAQKAVEILQRKSYPVDLVVLYGRPPKVVPDYLNAADVMLLTSLWEGSPNVVKEAMACNLPIVSVDVGDVREVISGTEGCFIVPRDPWAIADRLTWILAWGKRTDGRARIGHLDSRLVAKRLIALYRSLMRR